MTLEEFKTTLYKLENVMYGHNYEVLFGIDIFENCSDIEEFKIRLKKTYPKSKPETVIPITLTVANFWEEIDFGLAYRGDSSAGLILDSKRQEEFELLEKE